MPNLRDESLSPKTHILALPTPGREKQGHAGLPSRDFVIPAGILSGRSTVICVWPAALAWRQDVRLQSSHIYLDSVFPQTPRPLTLLFVRCDASLRVKHVLRLYFCIIPVHKF